MFEYYDGLTVDELVLLIERLAEFRASFEFARGHNDISEFEAMRNQFGKRTISEDLLEVLRFAKADDMIQIMFENQYIAHNQKSDNAEFDDIPKLQQELNTEILDNLTVPYELIHEESIREPVVFLRTTPAGILRLARHYNVDSVGFHDYVYTEGFENIHSELGRRLKAAKSSDLIPIIVMCDIPYPDVTDEDVDAFVAANRAEFEAIMAEITANYDGTVTEEFKAADRAFVARNFTLSYINKGNREEFLARVQPFLPDREPLYDSEFFGTLYIEATPAEIFVIAGVENVSLDYFDDSPVGDFSGEKIVGDLGE